MEHVILFRTQCDKLNENEFEMFTKKLFESYDKRTFMVQSMFYLFLDHAKKNKTDDNKKINQIITNIINLRKKKELTKPIIPISDNKHTSTSFNDLPSSLIAETSSYLTSASSQFMLTNRYIFCSCYPIPTLYTLSITNSIYDYLRNYGVSYESSQIEKLDRFRMMKHFVIRFNDLSDLKDYKLMIRWTDLNTLTINGSADEFGSDIDVNDEFVHIMDIWNNIHPKKLDLSNIRIGGEFDMNFATNLLNEFIGFLCKSTNTQFLSISNLSLEYICSIDLAAVNFNDFNKLKLLKGLIMHNTSSDITDNIINTLNHQLQSIHVCANNQINDRLNDKIKYNKLLEACFIDYTEHDPDYDTIMDHIIKNAPYLTRIHWKIPSGFNTNDICIIIQLIFKNALSLEYLCVDGECKLNDILKHIIDELQSNTLKRRNFKLRIGCSVSDEIDQDFIKENVLKIVELMEKRVINDFMFIITLKINKEMNGIEKQFEDMNKKYIVNIMDINNYDDDDIIKFTNIYISNNNNSMCGYHERWIINCEYCDMRYDTIF